MPGLIDLDALTDIDHLILDSWAGPEQAKGHQWSEDYFRNRRADVFTAGERQQIREYALIQLDPARHHHVHAHRLRSALRVGGTFRGAGGHG